MFCLFCGNDEGNYKPNSDSEIICSTCVQLLLSLEQGVLQTALEKAEELGLQRKALALKSFIIEDETNDRKTKSTERNMVRTRPMRKAGLTRDKVRT